MTRVCDNKCSQNRIQQGVNEKEKQDRTREIRNQRQPYNAQCLGLWLCLSQKGCRLQSAVEEEQSVYFTAKLQDPAGMPCSQTLRGERAGGGARGIGGVGLLGTIREPNQCCWGAAKCCKVGQTGAKALFLASSLAAEQLVEGSCVELSFS